MLKKTLTSLLLDPAKLSLTGVSSLSFWALFLGGVPSAETFRVSVIVSGGVYSYLGYRES